VIGLIQVDLIVSHLRINHCSSKIPASSSCGLIEPGYGSVGQSVPPPFPLPSEPLMIDLVGRRVRYRGRMFKKYVEIGLLFLHQ